MNKEQYKDIIKEFEEKFIQKGGTDNRWLWKMHGYHPNVIVDFFEKALTQTEKNIREEIKNKLLKYKTKDGNAIILDSEDLYNII